MSTPRPADSADSTDKTGVEALPKLCPPRMCLVCRSFKETDWYDNFEFFNVVHRSHADKLKVRRDTGHVWVD